MRKLIIDRELAKWLPLASDQSYSELERQLIADGGPREPIRVWKGRDIIIDGHRRYSVCVKHNLPFRVEELEFASVEDVKSWMIRWQIARRNMSVHDESLAMARLAFIIGGKNPVSVTQSVKEAAAASGVSERTVFRAKQYADALESLDEGVREQIVSGDIKASKQDVVDLGDLTVAEQKDIVRQFKDGEFDTLREAIHGDGRAEEDDSLSPPAKPNKKPNADLFSIAIKQLGAVHRMIGDIGTAAPGRRYNEARRASVALGEILEAWRKEVA